MFATNINSFKRFASGIFAPTAANWVINNRTTALRVIPGSAKSQHVELRVPGSDSNPCLVGACLLAAGMQGIAQKSKPTDPAQGASHLKKKDLQQQFHFPSDFRTAVERFHKPEHARTLFGDDFVEMFADTRRAQIESFSRMMTGKELERFLELA
jgi:glutamine synthetase